MDVLILFFYYRVSVFPVSFGKCVKPRSNKAASSRRTPKFALLIVLLSAHILDEVAVGTEGGVCGAIGVDIDFACRL
jgi:hypothetical protein